jgi:hypothetical protein
MNEKHIIIISIIGLVLLFHNIFNNSTIINEDFNNCKISTCSSGYVFDTNKTTCIKSTSTNTTPAPTNGLSTSEILNPLLVSYYSTSGPFAGTYSIIPVVTNVIDINNVDM